MSHSRTAQRQCKNHVDATYVVREATHIYHSKKLKVVLTLLWLFELKLEYTIATAGKCFRDKHRAMSNRGIARIES